MNINSFKFLSFVIGLCSTTLLVQQNVYAEDVLKNQPAKPTLKFKFEKEIEKDKIVTFKVNDKVEVKCETFPFKVVNNTKEVECKLASPDLEPSTNYTIKSSVEGTNLLSVLKFETAKKPEIEKEVPNNGDKIDKDTKLSLTFTEQMDPTSIEKSVEYKVGISSKLEGKWKADSEKKKFEFETELDSGLEYKRIIPKIFADQPKSAAGFSIATTDTTRNFSTKSTLLEQQESDFWENFGLGVVYLEVSDRKNSKLQGELRDIPANQGQDTSGKSGNGSSDAIYNVTKIQKRYPSILLETHIFPYQTGKCKYKSAKELQIFTEEDGFCFGAGPFIGLTSDLTTHGAGIMVGIRNPNANASFNIGFGNFWKQMDLVKGKFYDGQIVDRNDKFISNRTVKFNGVMFSFIWSQRNNNDTLKSNTNGKY